MPVAADGGTPPGRDAVVDPAALAQLTELLGGPEYVRELLAEFRAEAAGLVDRMRDALPDRPHDSRMAAHSLKSSAANVGATRLAQLAAQAESAAKEGAVERLAELVPGLAAELDRVVEALETADG